MGEFLFIGLLILAYPFIAAMMVGASRGRRLQALEQEVTALRKQLQELATRAQASPSQPASTASVEAPSPAPAPSRAPNAAPTPAFAYKLVGMQAPLTVWAPWPPSTTPRPAAATTTAIPATTQPTQPKPLAANATPPATPNTKAPKASNPPPTPTTPPRWLIAARDWLLTGNPVAKLGLVILFIGVGFLLKYVAATVVVPIELRLAGVVLADLALLGWGWRLRTWRREIGLPVQGTAIAILMLVIFGAYQRYGLLPAGFAFALLVALTVSTCLLAVLQEAVWLAVFGITGGFAAPLLVSTGQGNHVALFSYYALLNAGVFALAIQRGWRPLNLIGFAFTFIVGALWGGLRYTPDHYASAQGFLILFFLFYVGIALAHAHRQRTRLKDYVDATLVLGTPLLAFGLQAGLVRDMHFGIAFSALALAGFYLTLATVLWHHGRERWRVLVETFAALGVVFGTLAIPFALDGRWTSGAWALEGAGFVWFGLRRGQRRTWLFGMLLQAGAWLSFVGAAAGLDVDAALNSNLWLGFVLLAGSAFAMAAGLRRYAGTEAPIVGQLANWCLAIAAIWLLAGSWTEAIIRTSGSTLANWLVAGAVLTTVLLVVIASRLAWRMAGVLALAAQLLGAAGLVVVVASDWRWLGLFGGEGGEPLSGALMIALAALATSRMIAQARLGQIDARLAPPFLAWGGIWWFGPVVNIAAARAEAWLPYVFGGMHARWMLLYAAGVGMSVIACTRLARRLQWTQLRWLGIACWVALAAVTVDALTTLYGDWRLPDLGVWLAWAILLAGGEDVLRQWARTEAPLMRSFLQAIHLLRTAGPWFALWPLGAILAERWLGASGGSVTDAATSAAWGTYVQTWAMMLALAALLRRSRADAWPTRPLSGWYRATVIPCAAVMLLVLAGLWNISQDGTMAPLPYLPLLNPLDITTGFALMLWIGAMDLPANRPGDRQRRLRIGAMVMAYAWFNLILLRSAAHYLGTAYRLDELADSQFVQAMLSLVWSASALVLMRYAAQHTMRRTWGTGTLLLGVVVCKLFMVDLANGGSMARVVSFVGVGLLMLLIGYFAPYPKAAEGRTSPSAGT